MVRKPLILFIFSVAALFYSCKVREQSRQQKLNFYRADNENIHYTGRILFSNPEKPRFWAPGVYIQARFKGTACEVIVNDEELWGKNHNYLEISIDGKQNYRVQTKGKTDTIRVAQGLKDGPHTITICKNTESSIGYLEFVGLRCNELLSAPIQLKRKLEFIGNSITCGTGSDLSVYPCGKGEWYDQHNAYLSYGPATARMLNSRWMLTSYSGIGLIHSCCGIKTTMPQLFDKVIFYKDSIRWDFSRYLPDAVAICLGQNDGIQDSTAFCSAYVDFIGKIRSHYPDADIVCLTSPMADAALTPVLKNYLTGIVSRINKHGDKNVYKYFFSKQYHHGCGGHPDLAEHQQIAEELAGFLKKTLNW